MPVELAQVRDAMESDLGKLAVAGLVLPTDYSLARLVFELVDAYYKVESSLPEEEKTTQFVTKSTPSAVQDLPDGYYGLTQSFIITGAVTFRLGNVEPAPVTPPVSEVAASSSPPPFQPAPSPQPVS